MKKLLICIFCLTILFSFAACDSGNSSYDDSDLKDSIAQLEQDKADLQGQIDDLQGQIDDLQEQIDDLQGQIDDLQSVQPQTYNLGDTAFVYSNGIKIFSIKYVSDDGNFTHTFEVTNIALPYISTQDYVYAIVVHESNGHSSPLTIHWHSHIELGQTQTITMTSSGNPGLAYIYFSYDATRIPYAIFNIAHS